MSTLSNYNFRSRDCILFNDAQTQAHALYDIVRKDFTKYPSRIVRLELKKSFACVNLYSRLLVACRKLHGVTNDKGNSVLHEAVCCRQRSLVHLLLDRGHNVNSQNMEGNTPLHLAMRIENKSIVQTLLKSAPNLLIENGCEETAADVALRYQHFDSLALLVHGCKD